MTPRPVLRTIVAPDALFLALRTKIVALAARGRLSAIYNQREFVDVGGLMGCGPGIRHAYDQTAVFADRTLECANPGGAPVERSTTFALAIGVAAAWPLGIRMPPTMMAPAERVFP